MNRPGAWLALPAWLLVSFLPALLGFATRPGAWYQGLNRPAWNPPSWVFAPAWTFLYATMGVAAWLVWRRRGAVPTSVALGLFLAQLALNAAWSWLFFGMRRPDLALVDIVALWLAILATIVAFWRVAPPAGGLLLPYLAWVTFATALNGAIWQMNR